MSQSNLLSNNLSFNDIPFDIIVKHIIPYLDDSPCLHRYINDITNLSLTCRRYRHINKYRTTLLAGYLSINEIIKLCKISNIKELYLHDIDIDDDIFEQILPYLHNLTLFSCIGCIKLTKSSIIKLSEQADNITSMVFHNSRIHHDIDMISRFTKLIYLDTDVHLDDISKLSSLVNLETLELDTTYTNMDKILAQLP